MPKSSNLLLKEILKYTTKHLLKANMWLNYLSKFQISGNQLSSNSETLFDKLSMLSFFKKMSS